MVYYTCILFARIYNNMILLLRSDIIVHLRKVKKKKIRFLVPIVVRIKTNVNKNSSTKESSFVCSVDIQRLYALLHRRCCLRVQNAYFDILFCSLFLYLLDFDDGVVYQLRNYFSVFIMFQKIVCTLRVWWKLLRASPLRIIKIACTIGLIWSEFLNKMFAKIKC